MNFGKIPTMDLFPAGVPFSKRLFDILGSLIGIIITAPFMLLIGFFVLLTIGWPIFYCQERPGKGGKIFRLCKFRTMNNKRDENGKLLADKQRITKFGKFLRRFSLDEIPELINVLKGDMSLVGPRPLLIAYLERYSSEQARRHEVLPGITGWAQINGRNAISWEAKFEHDVWYVDHWTFWLDIKILFITIWKTFTGEGISQPGHATAEEFKGNK